MRGLREIIHTNTLAAQQEIAAQARKGRPTLRVGIKRRQGAATILTIGETEVLFSYETPVAAFIPDKGYLQTNINYSRNTTKHINQYLSGTYAEVVPQSVINQVVRA